MTSAPIILVPGFWLGAWAWDDVADRLRADGHDVTALTLPGMESNDTDRSSITFDDHVDAILDALRAAEAPVVLAVHSGTGFSGYAASDRIPELIAHMVYVDTAPGTAALDPDFDDVEKPLPSGSSSPRRRTSTGSARNSSRRSASAPSPSRPPRCASARAHERRAARRPEHGHLHGVHLRAVPGGRRGGSRPGSSAASRSCAT